MPNDGRPDFAANPFNGPVPTYEAALANACDINFRPGCVRRAFFYEINTPWRRLPYSHQASMGVQRQLGATMSVDADYVYTGGRDEESSYNMKTLQRIGGRVNLAVIGYSTYVPPVLIPQSLLLLRLFKPDVYMPMHHDDIGGERLVTPVEPLFMAIRDELPDTRPISPLYRSPICIDTQSKEVFVGR